MKANSFESNFYQKVVDLGLNRPWSILFGVLYTIIAIFALTNVVGRYPFELNQNLVLFLLSSVVFLLLIIIGYSLHTNGYRVIWGLSFLVYAVTFVGFSLNAINISIVNLNNPFFAQIWLLPLILFSSGIWIGITSLFFENKKIIYLPSLFIFILGNIWYLFGLNILNNLELTISVYSLGILAPVILGSTIVWYHFGKYTRYVSPWFFTLGFGLLGIVHIFWNPWVSGVLGQMNIPFFILFIISLSLILKGFLTLTKESTSCRNLS
ncbi:MAG: hypothetical protein ACFFAU_17150 [Candidatus Hodarchaeota archaeon]